MKKEVILISGGTGFLGSYLTHELLKLDYQIIILKRARSNTWRIDDIIDRIKCYNIDNYDMEHIYKDQHIDIVIHTSCCYGKSQEKVCEIADTNIIFGLKLFEFASLYKTKLFINTDTLLQKEISPYSLSKKQFVEWLKFMTNATDVDIQVINMRLEHMYGPKDDINKFIPWIIEQLGQNVKEIPFTSGIQERDFIYITDVILAYLTVINNKLPDKFMEFDVGSGVPVSVREFVSCLIDEYKKIHQNNMSQPVFGALPYRKGELMKIGMDIEPLRALGWEPQITHEEGVKNTLKCSY
jgi:nucleoside-diphosphate-sugar epimerase